MFQWYSWPLLAALSLISALVLADEAVTPNGDATTAAAPAAVGVQVFIDEATGEVRSPTEAETAEIAEQFRRKFIDLSVDKPPVYHADGSISKELGSRYQMYTVARLTGDGQIETQCLPAEQAADFLANGEQTRPETKDPETQDKVVGETAR